MPLAEYEGHNSLVKIWCYHDYQMLIYLVSLLQISKKVDHCLKKLSAIPIAPVGFGDENVAESLRGGKHVQQLTYNSY